MALLVVPCVTGTEISPDHHGAYGRGELDRGSHLGHIFFWADVSRLWDPALGLVPLGLSSGVREKQPPWFRCSPKGMLIWFPWEEGVLHLSKIKCLWG